MATTKKYALKGINDDQSVCAICGKVELKRVMWIVELDNNGNEVSDPFHCGTTCGARMLGYTQSVMKTKSNKFESYVNNQRSFMRDQKANELGYRRFLTELNKLELPFKERRVHPLYGKMMNAINQATEWANSQSVIMPL